MSMLKLGGDEAKSVPRRWVCAPLWDSIGGYWIRHIFLTTQVVGPQMKKLEFIFFLKQYQSSNPQSFSEGGITTQKDR